jgi:Asp/Glu/hydantoin racemase
MNVQIPATPSQAALRKRNIHGVSIGIIILDTRFHRVAGDIGYAGTFDFPVQYAVARGIVRGGSVTGTDGELKAFFEAADELVALGVDGITTSCGFLSILQPYLTEHCSVPVAASSLMQVPIVQRMLPKGRRVGVLTANRDSFTPGHLTAVGADPDTPVRGMPVGSTFRSHSREARPIIDRDRHEEEVLEQVGQLLAEHPDIGAIVFECTNLGPYSHAVEARYGLPVYDVITLIDWFHAGLKPRRY